MAGDAGTASLADLSVMYQDKLMCALLPRLTHIPEACFEQAEEVPERNAGHPQHARNMFRIRLAVQDDAESLGLQRIGALTNNMRGKHTTRHISLLEVSTHLQVVILQPAGWLLFARWVLELIWRAQLALMSANSSCFTF